MKPKNIHNRSQELDIIHELFKMLNERDREQAKLYRESKERIVHPVVASNGHYVGLK